MNKNLRSEAPPPEPPRNNPCSLGIACIYDWPYLYISCKHSGQASHCAGAIETILLTFSSHLLSETMP